MPKVSLDYGTSVMPFLASFCDEAHDASDAQSGIVSDWYKGYTTPEYNPMTSYCMIHGVIILRNTPVQYILDQY